MRQPGTPAGLPRGLRRRAAFAAVALGVVGLHWWTLADWPIGRGESAQRGGVQALQVRQIAAAVMTAPARTDGSDVTGAVATVPRAGSARHAGAAAAAGVPPAAAAPRLAAEEPRAPMARQGAADPAEAMPAPATADAAWPMTTPAPVAPGAAAAAGSDAGGAEPPRYATRMPPSGTLRYEFRRGASRGEGELAWRVDGDRYELGLHGGNGGAETIGWTSRGRIGIDGTAPERFVVRRRGRDFLAVNFQRDDADGGRITFSGPSLQLPLMRGVQDRVSWMLQLAGILEADPTLGSAGASVSMWVVGPRGDAEVWTFAVQPRSAVESPAGDVAAAVHLVRAPTRPYDTRVSVWLDPARHHLPVRALLESHPSGESTEWRLRALNDK